MHVNIHIKILVLHTGVTHKFCLHEPSNPFLIEGGGRGGDVHAQIGNKEIYQKVQSHPNLSPHMELNKSSAVCCLFP